VKERSGCRCEPALLVLHYYVCFVLLDSHQFNSPQTTRFMKCQKMSWTRISSAVIGQKCLSTKYCNWTNRNPVFQTTKVL